MSGFLSLCPLPYLETNSLAPSLPSHSIDSSLPSSPPANHQNILILRLISSLIVRWPGCLGIPTYISSSFSAFLLPLFPSYLYQLYILSRSAFRGYSLAMSSACVIPHLWPNSHKIDTSNLVLCFGSAQHRFFNSSIIFHLIALWFVPVQLARSDWVVLLCSPRVLLVLNGRNLDA